MKEENTTKDNGKNAKDEKFDLEVYFTRADESTRHFIAELATILTAEIPVIQSTCKTQEEFTEKIYPVLDRLCDAFTTAQTDAIKCAAAQVSDAIGAQPIWAPREKKD